MTILTSSGDSHQSSIYIVSLALFKASDIAYLHLAPASSTVSSRRAYPKVIPAIDIPLDQIAFSFWRKALKAVTLTDATSLLIRLLLMVLVMAMIRIDQIRKLPHLVLRVRRLHLRIVKMRILELLAQMRKRMRDPIFYPPIACVVCHICLVGVREF